MVYVALLRGINVGGKAKVEMSRLKTLFETLGHTQVKTFINSGNVIFMSDKKPAVLVQAIEKAILKEFGLPVDVLLRDLPQMEETVKAVPKNWVNDAEHKCDIMFLQADIDNKDIVSKMPFVDPKGEVLQYVPGAIFWHADRAAAKKSKVLKIIGTPLYKRMTIRNVNSTRKILALMQALEQ